MPRVTRLSSRKVQLDDSEVSADKGSKTEPVEPKHTRTVQENHNHAVSSDSEDDEAPESIPLSSSKQAAIAEIHKEKETLQVLKEKERQRRRERDEFFKKQKESRKARELSRLPADILEKVAQKHEMVAMQQNKIKATDATVSMHVNFDSDDEEEENMTQLAVNEEQKGVQVVVLSQASKNKKRVLDSASEFLKNHFYGDRLKRVETLDDENQKRKRRNLGPAIQFSKTASKTSSKKI